MAISHTYFHLVNSFCWNLLLPKLSSFNFRYLVLHAASFYFNPLFLDAKSTQISYLLYTIEACIRIKFFIHYILQRPVCDFIHQFLVKIFVIKFCYLCFISNHTYFRSFLLGFYNYDINFYHMFFGLTKVRANCVALFKVGWFSSLIHQFNEYFRDTMGAFFSFLAFTAISKMAVSSISTTIF